MKLFAAFFLLCLSFSPLCLAYETTSTGMEALELSAKNNQYLYLFFYKDQSAKTIQSQRLFDQTIQTLGPRVHSIKINVKDPNEEEIVSKFELERSPMPLVLVIAPNGAITGGFPSSFSSSQLRDAITSPCMASCLKGLQEQKLVFLSIQNSQTSHNDEALRGVHEFCQDPRFENKTQLVLIDPSDKNETCFLRQFDVDTTNTQATTVFLAPPGDKLGKYIGPTQKDQFVTDLQNALSECPH